MKKLLFVLFLFSYSCASLRERKIEIPKDIVEKTQSVLAVKEPEKTKVKKDKKKININNNKKRSSEKTEDAEQKIPQIDVETPFKVGEKITFELSYLGITAALLRMETLPTVVFNQRKAYHFYGLVTTYSIMNLIYRVHDSVEVYLDTEHLIPLKMALHIKESKQNVEQVVLYDHDNKKALYWKKRIDAKDNLTETRREDYLEPFSQDILSVYYFVRTQNIELGNPLFFNIYDNNNTWQITVDVIGEEIIKTAIGRFDTFILKPTVKKDGELHDKGDILVWITKDERKLPVKFKSKVKIGSISGDIKEYKLD